MTPRTIAGKNTLMPKNIKKDDLARALQKQNTYTHRLRPDHALRPTDWYYQIGSGTRGLNSYHKGLVEIDGVRYDTKKPYGYKCSRGETVNAASSKLASTDSSNLSESTTTQ